MRERVINMGAMNAVNAKCILAAVPGSLLVLLALSVVGPLGLAVAQGQGGSRVTQLPVPSGPSTTDRVIEGGDAYPHVELVTMGVGSLIWERHGHIAICIQWGPERDVCYNYGIADFADPIGMGVSFFRAEPSFWVGATTRRSLYSVYLRADRTVWVQRIPMTAEQKRQVIEKLEFDVLVENRYYSYDHFFDNCTTRVRDILDDALDGALSKIETPIGEGTIRDYARKGFLGDRIALLITDLFMGRVTDKVATYWERLYLPKYLRIAFEAEFGVEAVVAYQRKGAPPLEDGPSGRFILFLIILMLTAPAWITALIGRFRRLGLGLAVFVPGLLGLIIWTGVVLSPVSYVRWNEAFFILVPFDWALPFILNWRGGRPARRYAQLRVAGLIFVTLLLAVGIFAQPLWVFVLWPLIPCTVVAFPQFFDRKRRTSLPAEASSDETDKESDTGLKAAAQKKSQQKSAEKKTGSKKRKGRR